MAKAQRKTDIPPDQGDGHIDAGSIRTDVDTGSEHDYHCSIPVGSHLEDAYNTDMGKIKVYDYCQESAAFVPIVRFRGREMRMRKDDQGKVEFFRSSKVREMPVQFQPVCARHRKLIEENPRVLLTPQVMRAQERSLVDAGHPAPEGYLTKLKFIAFEPPEAEVESEVLDALVATARGEEVLSPEETDMA